MALACGLDSSTLKFYQVEMRSHLVLFGERNNFSISSNIDSSTHNVMLFIYNHYYDK